MTEIVRAIYDMMGKYTYPALKGDVPQQHVDAFFKVSYKVNMELMLESDISVNCDRSLILKPLCLHSW